MLLEHYFLIEHTSVTEGKQVSYVKLPIAQTPETWASLRGRIIKKLQKINKDDYEDGTRYSPDKKVRLEYPKGCEKYGNLNIKIELVRTIVQYDAKIHVEETNTRYIIRPTMEEVAKLVNYEILYGEFKHYRVVLMRSEVYEQKASEIFIK